MTTPSAVLESEHREVIESFETFVRRELEPLTAELGGDADIPPRAFGRPIGDYQHIQEHLVSSHAEVEASKLLTFACAQLVDAGAATPENAALAKLTASMTAVRVVDRSLQIHGAAGWVKGHPLEFLYRHVRMMTIIEGTTEIQKVIIARSMGLGGDLEGQVRHDGG
jgi:alkylation response protein AidB-like acyl-CoA dehydrogenase